MNIFVLGGSGRTGQHVIDRALQRGHRVTAFGRSQLHVAPRPGVRLVVGDVRDRDALSSTVANHDAVISCLGQKSAADVTLLRDSAHASIAAMSEHDIRRLVVISQGLLFPASTIIVPILRLLLARHIEDSLAMEAVVCNSALDWTIVRPPYLIDGKIQRGYRMGLSAMPKRSVALSRTDLASLLLDEVDTSPHLRAIVGVASR